MSSKVSLLRALRRQKKEGERKARGERRAHLVSSTVFPATRRRSCSSRACFCEDTWRKKRCFLLVYKQSKAQSYCLPPPLSSPRHSLTASYYRGLYNPLTAACPAPTGTGTVAWICRVNRENACNTILIINFRLTSDPRQLGACNSTHLSVMTTMSRSP